MMGASISAAVDSQVDIESVKVNQARQGSFRGHAIKVLRVGGTVIVLMPLSPFILLIEGIHYLFLKTKGLFTKVKEEAVTPLRDLSEIKAKMIQAHPEREAGIHYRLAHATNDELVILHYLHDTCELDQEQLYQIMCGAHVVLEDQGQAYQVWSKTIVDKKLRGSSHPSDVQQYAVRGALLSEFLFGMRDEKTWFQLENTPLTLGFIIRHMFDFIKHALSDKNIGPGGKSSYTHHLPLRVKLRSQSTEAA